MGIKGEAHGVREVAEAIASLEEIIGSSQYAKTKFIKGKHKELPPTYTKLVLIRLNKTVAASKLIKVKNSFKLAPIKPAPVKAAVLLLPRSPKLSLHRSLDYLNKKYGHYS